MNKMSLRIGSLLLSNVPGGRRVFTSLLVVVPHEGRGGRGTRPVVNKTLVRTRHVHVAAFARLIVSVGLACAVADAVAASTNDASWRRGSSNSWRSRTSRRRRWRRGTPNSTRTAVGQYMFDDVTINDKKSEKYETVCKETDSVYVLILWREQTELCVLLDNGNEQRIVFGHVENICENIPRPVKKVISKSN